MAQATGEAAADSRLRLLVCAVAALALVPLGWALSRVLADPAGLGVQLLLFASLVGLANIAMVVVRIKTTNHGIAPMSAAILVCVVYLPPQWAILCTAVGVLAIKVVTRLSPLKATFSVAKESLTTSAAAGAAHAFGLVPLLPGGSGPQPIVRQLLALVAAAVAYAVVDELVSVPVLALASRTTMRRRISEHWDVRTAIRLGSLLVAAVVLVAKPDVRLLIGLPPLLYALHLASAIRIRARTERDRDGSPTRSSYVRS